MFNAATKEHRGLDGLIAGAPAALQSGCGVGLGRAEVPLHGRSGGLLPIPGGITEHLVPLSPRAVLLSVQLVEKALANVLDHTECCLPDANYFCLCSVAGRVLLWSTSKRKMSYVMTC